MFFSSLNFFIQYKISHEIGENMTNLVNAKKEEMDGCDEIRLPG